MAKEKVNNKQKLPSTQQFLPIKEIKEGIAIMRDGSMRSILMISSMNFALKGEDEKNSIISSYQAFLNSLNFPVQIYIKSRKLHLDNYINKLNKTLETQTNVLLRQQTTQYVDFIGELLQYANIMEKRFFVIVPYFPTGVEQVNWFKSLFSSKKAVETNFELEKTELMQRVNEVISGLTSVGLRVAALNTEEIVELYYAVYNPDTAGNERITDSENLVAPIIETRQSKEGGDNA
jgi:hypothetical protein